MDELLAESSFSRTPGGLAEKWRFHGVPTVWVEGPDDVPFYRVALMGIACRIECYKGEQNVHALVAGLVESDYPYIVICDGHYDILSRKRAAHGRVIRLQRHSMENYLWEPDLINDVFLGFIKCGEPRDFMSRALSGCEEVLESTLLASVILDVAFQGLNPRPRVLPERIEAILEAQDGVSISMTRVLALRESVTLAPSSEALERSRALVTAFLKRRPFVHLLKGHLLMGMLRRVFVSNAKCEGSPKQNIGEDSFLTLICHRIWSSKSKDHLNLRRKLRSTVRGLVETCAGTPALSLE